MEKRDFAKKEIQEKEEKKMIFIAKNEKGEPTWKLALEKRKTVTRRLKPLPVGKEFAIQPGRGKFAVCRAGVVSCVNSFEHFRNSTFDTNKIILLENWKQAEAHLEGFGSWDALMRFFQDKKIQFADTFRIEYELIN